MTRPLEERKQLFRIAAQRVVDNHNAGRKVDPDALQWARDILIVVKPAPIRTDGAPCNVERSGLNRSTDRQEVPR